jgi:hypothetical protein
MANVYIEPKPKGRDEHEAIDHYMAEYQHGAVHSGPYKTQEDAIKAVKASGHDPLVARVRMTDKGEAGHWRSA